MALPRGRGGDRFFAFAWSVTILGGVALFASAFVVGLLLEGIGIAISASGFALIGYALLRATPDAGPATRIVLRARAAPDPDGGDPPAPDLAPVDGVGSTAENDPPPDPSIDLPEPAPVPATWGGPSLLPVAGGPPVDPRSPAVVPVAALDIGPAPSAMPDPEPASAPGPSSRPVGPSAAGLAAVVPPEPDAPASAAVVPPEPDAPASAAVVPPEPDAPASAAIVPARDGPEPWSEEPETGSSPSPPPWMESVPFVPPAPVGEVLPVEAARSLAMLGLAWGSDPPELAGPAPGAPSPADLEPWADEVPSIVFVGGAFRFAPEELRAGPADRPYESRQAGRFSRSGGYGNPGPKGEGLSEPWVVPVPPVLRTPPTVPDSLGLVTRVPEPPARSFRPPSRCTACGEPSSPGATGENRCWGCGRPVCADCFWRYGPGPGVHRCPSCVALGPPMSVSGGRRFSRGSGPFSGVDEPEWTEGL